MKMVCIDNRNSGRINCLTIGKIYTILNRIVVTDLFCVVNDLGTEDFYSTVRFISLKEYRKRKLKKLNEKR